MRALCLKKQTQKIAAPMNMGHIFSEKDAKSGRLIILTIVLENIIFLQCASKSA